MMPLNAVIFDDVNWFLLMSGLCRCIWQVAAADIKTDAVTAWSCSHCVQALSRWKNV